MKKAIFFGLAVLALGVFWLACRESSLAPQANARMPLVKSQPVSAVRRLLSSPEPLARQPDAEEDAFRRLTAESIGQWQIHRDENGIGRMYGARLPVRDSGAAAGRRFLREFGAALGLAHSQLRLERASRMGDNTQLVYSQMLNGMPVFGSRINLVFDSDGNLIYLSSAAYQGSPQPGRPVAKSLAARSALEGLSAFCRRSLLPIPDISPSEMEREGSLGYLLSGGHIFFVYLFSVAARQGPLDVQVLVDGATGALINVKNLLKNK